MTKETMLKIVAGFTCLLGLGTWCGSSCGTACSTPKTEEVMHLNIPDSKAITAIEYNPQKQILDVTFVHGDTYRYSEVTGEEFQEFQAAPSKGSYFQQFKSKHKGSLISNTNAASCCPKE